MLVIDSIRLRDHSLVEALRLPRLVSTDEQDRYSLGIEGEEDAHRLRDSQLLHVGVPGALYRVDQWPAGGWPKLLQSLNRGDNLALLGVGQRLPPTVELVGSLGAPTHLINIT